MAATVSSSTEVESFVRTRRQTINIFGSSSKLAFVFPDAQVGYPKTVCDALLKLYHEYNVAFRALIAINREWSTDYRYCLDSDQEAVNWIVQVDMVGLTDKILESLAYQKLEHVAEALRSKIFEIENSWAAYQVHARALDQDGSSLYSQKTKAMLHNLRNRFQKPIALLAVTDEKYAAMRESEFNKTDGEPLSDGEVFHISGFDKFFSPVEFCQYIADNGDMCDYLLYVRASHPVPKLRNPDIVIEQPLLSNPKMRQLIKAHTLTINIDDPAWAVGDSRRINDTKLYLCEMRMASPVNAEEELELASNNFDNRRLRAKPAQGSYGCYGHVSGYFSDREFRYEVRRGLRKWGRYLVQPEHEASTVTNTIDGREYAFMDRIFCGMTKKGPEFFGGHRLFLPRDSLEARKGRLHIVDETIFSEIVPVTSGQF